MSVLQSLWLKLTVIHRRCFWSSQVFRQKPWVGDDRYSPCVHFASAKSLTGCAYVTKQLHSYKGWLCCSLVMETRINVRLTAPVPIPSAKQLRCTLSTPAFLLLFSNLNHTFNSLGFCCPLLKMFGITVF